MPMKPRTHRPLGPGIRAHAASDRERNQEPHRKLLWSERYRRFRRWFLIQYPLCQRCELPTPAEHVHHKRKLRDHHEDLCDPEQCEALCATCHNAATARGE